MRFAAYSGEIATTYNQDARLLPAEPSVGDTPKSTQPEGRRLHRWPTTDCLHCDRQVDHKNLATGKPIMY